MYCDKKIVTYKYTHIHIQKINQKKIMNEIFYISFKNISIINRKQFLTKKNKFYNK